MVAIPKKVASRLSTQIGTFQKVLKKAKDRDVNESDTVTVITDMLSDVFGYDKYSEITSEQAIRGTYCDLAIKMDGGIKYLIEVKAIGITLKENHLRQAINYGANQGIPWVVLTNGIDWEIHRIRFERPVSSELICSFNFLDLNPRRSDDQNSLFLLCKEGLSKDAIEKFHERVQSVNRFVVGAILLTDPILNSIRKELRRLSHGVKVVNDEIDKLLRTEVLKREVVDGDFAVRAKRRVGIVQAHSKRKPRARAASKGNLLSADAPQEKGEGD